MSASFPASDHFSGPPWDQFIEARRSRIHGKGLFATRNLPKTEVLIVIRGELIDTEESIRRERQQGNVYIFWHGELYIDAAHTAKIKFINHACDPNCEVVENDRESLCLVSLSEIRFGEEITMDYGYDEIYKSCNCPSCRRERQPHVGSIRTPLYVETIFSHKFNGVLNRIGPNTDCC